MIILHLGTMGQYHELNFQNLGSKMDIKLKKYRFAYNSWTQCTHVQHFLTDPLLHIFQKYNSQQKSPFKTMTFAQYVSTALSTAIVNRTDE